jgi:hypothetical protein
MGATSEAEELLRYAGTRAAAAYLCLRLDIPTHGTEAHLRLLRFVAAIQ